MKKRGKTLSFRSSSLYNLNQKLDAQKIIANGYFVKSPPNDKIRTQVSRWQHRWFVLYNATPGFEIYYYKKVNHQKDGEEPLGKINLHNASVTSLVGHFRFRFVITLHTDERVWHLCTDEKETYNTWFEKLKICCPSSPVFAEPKYSFLPYDCNEASEMKNILDETSLPPKETTFRMSSFVSSSSSFDSNDLVDPPLPSTPKDPSFIDQSIELSSIFKENAQNYQGSSLYNLNQKLDAQKIIANGYFVKSPPNDKIRTQVSRWQHRWFVLYNATPGFEIYYYKKVNHQEDGEEPLGKIKLHNASVTSLVGHFRFRFVITLHTDERVWHLCTDEKETYNTWFEKLKICCPSSPVFAEPKYGFLTCDCNEASEIKNILEETSLSPKETTFRMSSFVSSSSFDSNDLVDPPSPSTPKDFSVIDQSIELSPIFKENTQSYQDSMLDVRYDRSNFHLPLRYSSFTSNIIHDDIFGNDAFQGPRLQKKINSKMSINRSCENLLDAI
ncbi:uncharacterized protein LOC136089213 [Hydra vulgaris]|uniref:Uncharacterized protein LOC136089213 n=1 Tax=Hydra vulgaris TaxID=6087 RepID=A0ABM4D9N1_HYDVU